MDIGVVDAELVGTEAAGGMAALTAAVQGLIASLAGGGKGPKSTPGA